MRYLGIALIAVLSCCQTLSADEPGTNSSGTSREWHAVKGAFGSSARGTFVSVQDGMVSIRLDTTHGKLGRLVRVPLSRLASDDRHWVEDKNPVACCLGSKSKKGSCGTLSPSLGTFRVAKRVDDENAIVEYRLEDKTVWTFWLRSSFVSQLKENESYKQIPPVADKKEASETRRNKTAKFLVRISEFRVGAKKKYEADKDVQSYTIIEDA